MTEKFENVTIPAYDENGNRIDLQINIKNGKITVNHVRMIET